MVKQVTRVKSTFVKAKTGVTVGHCCSRGYVTRRLQPPEQPMQLARLDEEREEQKVGSSISQPVSWEMGALEETMDFRGNSRILMEVSASFKRNSFS